MKDQNTNNIALLCVLLCGAFGACASEPLRGPEAWLELMGGNVRKDGLRLDLEAIKEAGFSGVQFFHIGDRAGKDQKGSMMCACWRFQRQKGMRLIRSLGRRGQTVMK